MNIQFLDITTPEQWIRKINLAIPKMSLEDRKRARRTIAYWDKWIKGKRGMVW